MTFCLRVEYNGFDTYLEEYGIPVLSIKCILFTYRERTMPRMCFVYLLVCLLTSS